MHELINKTNPRGNNTQTPYFQTGIGGGSIYSYMQFEQCVIEIQFNKRDYSHPTFTYLSMFCTIFRYKARIRLEGMPVEEVQVFNNRLVTNKRIVLISINPNSSKNILCKKIITTNRILIRLEKMIKEHAVYTMIKF